MTATRDTRSPADRSAGYLGRDLHEEGAWEDASPARYGLVEFDRSGHVLLREPLNHFDGYHWTFPKGGPCAGEHPVETALRETVEETGRRPVVLGHVPGTFRGTSTGSASFYYLAIDDDGPIDPRSTQGNPETASVRWVDPGEARKLIGLSTNGPGRDRDLRTLDAALGAFAASGSTGT